LNQLLNLNLVPTTVEARNSEGTTVSRQYFVRDSITAGALAEEEVRPEFEAIAKTGDYEQAWTVHGKKAGWC
jgi:hypothetical protein